MRTFFDLVLGILLIVAKTCIHGLISAIGIATLCALVVITAIFAWRRRFRQAASASDVPEAISIDR